RARTRAIPERVALRDQRTAQAAQQRRATLEPKQRIGGPGLEQARQRRRIDRGKRGSVDAQWIIPPRGERTAHEGTKARDGEPLRAHVALPPFGFDKTPCRAGAGIEQHAHHRTVDTGAPAIGDAAPLERAIELLLAIDATGFEVPP